MQSRKGKRFGAGHDMSAKRFDVSSSLQQAHCLEVANKEVSYQQNPKGKRFGAGHDVSGKRFDVSSSPQQAHCLENAKHCIAGSTQTGERGRSGLPTRSPRHRKRGRRP